MALDYDYLMGLPPMETYQTLTGRDTILYALGVGVAQAAPTDPHELQFVHEQGLKALPTMATVLAYPGFWMREPQYRLDWRKSLHVEQSIELHQPLPVEGSFRGITTIDQILDKGVQRGALLLCSRRIYAKHSGVHLATVRQTSMLRADGGFGGKPDDDRRPHSVPNRAPDFTVTLVTRPEQALLYRLSGDTNPIHVDAAVAAQAGFPRPILHGLCTLGVVGRAALKVLCENRPEAIRRIDARFSSHVFPGETLEVSIWQAGVGHAGFVARVAERNVVVITNGYVEYDL